MAIAIGRDARPAPVRAEMRATLRRARLAEWREGVWIRPDNLEVIEDPRGAWLDARPDADPVALAARLFHPAQWSRTAGTLVGRLEVTTTRLDADPERAIALAFMAGAAALRHIRADPLLPPELLPADWPGAALRSAYVAYQRRFDTAARDWFRRDQA
jgi:phenylacetic acid degradation operon negative regulatory protein